MNYKNKKIIISIIIPVFNSKKTIKKCLNSIFNQKINHLLFEVIIINDNSKDNSLSIIENFKKKFDNISIINNSKNIGPGFSRNKGLRVAKGNYIQFLDSDDHLYDNSLKVLISYISKFKFDILCYNFIHSYSKKIKKGNRKDFKYITNNKKKLIKNFFSGELDGSVIFTLIKKSIIDNNKITFPKYLHEDIPYIFEVYLCSKKIKIISEIIYFKKNRKNSILNTLNRKRISGLLTAWKKLLKVKTFEKIINKQKIKKEFLKFHARGYNGCVESLIILNLKLVTDIRLRIINFKYLFKFILNDNEIIKLNKSSKKDLITNHFIYFFKNGSINQSKVLKFEESIKKFKN